MLFRSTAFINRKRLRTFVSRLSPSFLSLSLDSLDGMLDDSWARGIGEDIADDDAFSSGDPGVGCFSRTKLEGEENACVKSSAIRL